MAISLPANLESTGAMLSARSLLEGQYVSSVDREVETFAAFLLAAALLSAEGVEQMPSTAQLSARWEESVQRLEARFPDSAALTRSALTSQGIETMTAAAIASATLARTAASSTAEARKIVRVAMGRSADPAKVLPGQLERLGLDGAAPGRVVGPEGSVSLQATSEAIARTAATADFASEMLQQLSREGYTHKRWSTRYDSRVRDTHVAADKTTIFLEESFIVGGAALRYPGDPMGPMSEIAGCRCVLTGVRYGEHELDYPFGSSPWNNSRP